MIFTDPPCQPELRCDLVLPQTEPLFNRICLANPSQFLNMALQHQSLRSQLLKSDAFDMTRIER